MPFPTGDGHQTERPRDPTPHNYGPAPEGIDQYKWDHMTAEQRWNTVVYINAAKQSQNVATWNAAAAPAAAAAAPGAAPTADPPIDEAAVREKYPQLAWALDIPEIKFILFAAASKGAGEAELQGMLYGTNWWKTHAASSRLWDQLKAQDPASAQARVEQEGRGIDNLARDWGIHFGGLEAFALAERKLRYGLDDNQMRLELGHYLRDHVKRFGSLPTGAVRTMANRIRQGGSEYLIGMDKKTVQKFAIQKAEGRITDEYVQAYYTQMAKNKFSWMADDIDRGATPATYFAPHRQAIANLWEQSEDEIDFINDPRAKAVVNYVDPETGKTRGMSINEAENFARRDKRWATTDNAREAAAGLGNQLLETFGKIAK